MTIIEGIYTLKKQLQNDLTYEEKEEIEILLKFLKKEKKDEKN